MKALFFCSIAAAATFHGAPDSALKLKNPYSGDAQDVLRRGGSLFAEKCASCHGADAKGTGNIPDLTSPRVQSVSDGELFWLITNGLEKSSMPAFRNLSRMQRWQIVTFVKNSKSAPQAKNEPHPTDEPPPAAPFTDYRFEKPGTVHKILSKDLGAPRIAVGNAPEIVPRPDGAWPIVPSGFKVQLFAENLQSPRLLRTAPNGDIFVAESYSNQIRVLRGIDAEGKSQLTQVFTRNVEKPYGIAFYPSDKPKWIYIGNSDSVVRFPYQVGDLKASGAPQVIARLPDGGGGHWTRDLQFSPDGKRLFVAVGSASNVDDPDTHSSEKNRADILVMDPDGKNMHVYASGLRNAGGGLMVQPKTGVLWASVNERDGLGDDLVPDYITHVEENGFYGWPWWYIGSHRDPRHPGKHPELRDKVIVPDVLLQPHHASLQFAFYEGEQFPAEYRGDIFAAQHGSWNRSVRAGYELIRVPFHGGTKASGEYEDFMTGFVVDNKHVWGRPVGVTVATDGSLLVSDDGSGSIWRIVSVRKVSP